MTTKQEKLWAGKFGNEYHGRNRQKNRSDFWYEVLSGRFSELTSVLELGAGQGDNLTAIGNYMVGKRVLVGLDINERACEVMKARGILPYNDSFIDAQLHGKYDLVLTRGFLIHQPLEVLEATLRGIYDLSSRYICIAEYYATKRRGMLYRGRFQALWADDFAGRLMEMYPDLKLRKYGFKYHTDDGDDITYFLLEKPVNESMR
jgi:spore coat polysaccharide biosynthesis protein SpsF